MKKELVGVLISDDIVFMYSHTGVVSPLSCCVWDLRSQLFNHFSKFSSVFNDCFAAFISGYILSLVQVKSK